MVKAVSLPASEVPGDMMFALGKIDGKVETILTKVSEVVSSQSKLNDRVNEHDTRITKIETDRAAKQAEHEANTKAIAKLIEEDIAWTATWEAQKEQDKKDLARSQKILGVIVALMTAVITAAPKVLGYS
jgi:septal ring factor EnvC (AmiA/AmiB activator)